MKILDRAVASLMRRDRLEAGLGPGLVGSGADRGGEERLGLGPAEDEVGAFAVRPDFVGHQLAPDDERHRDGAPAGAGLDVDRPIQKASRARVAPVQTAALAQPLASSPASRPSATGPFPREGGPWA